MNYITQKIHNMIIFLFILNSSYSEKLIFTTNINKYDLYSNFVY